MTLPPAPVQPKGKLFQTPAGRYMLLWARKGGVCGERCVHVTATLLTSAVD
jgi:hypothetical protein